MGLLDLKKQACVNEHKRIKINAEGFIDQALLYAQGLPGQQLSNHNNVIELVTGKATFLMLDRVGLEASEKKAITNKDVRYKNATFSLSLQAIDQLNELASELEVTKSYLMRQLIYDFYVTVSMQETAFKRVRNCPEITSRFVTAQNCQYQGTKNEV